MDEIMYSELALNVEPLRRISVQNGDVMHALKATEDSFSGFGEAYFSFIHFGCVKGWKCHNKMMMNLIVPVGAITFFCYSSDFRSRKSVTIGVEAEYSRLTVPPGIWVAFKGAAKGTNLLLNIADLPHNPEEASHINLDKLELW
jgi:dTDP-4-dehydrorhamnose 3,5-epimerase